MADSRFGSRERSRTRSNIEREKVGAESYATKDSVGVDRFYVVLASVGFLTLICLGVAVYLATLTASETVKSTHEAALTIFKLGCGAIIGLLGGKATG